MVCSGFETEFDFVVLRFSRLKAFGRIGIKYSCPCEGGFKTDNTPMPDWVDASVSPWIQSCRPAAFGIRAHPAVCDQLRSKDSP
jgi:hypothetical protein